MFVAIDNKDMDVFKIEEWINETRDANGGVISPEFAMEILSKTNFYGHIKKVLKNIKEKNKTKEELLAYKEFILSCVDEREMSPQALEMLQEMADVCEVRDEFDEKNAKPKWYDKDDCYKVVVVRTKEEFNALEGNDLRIFFDADEVDLTWCDLDKVKKIRFREEAEVDLKGAKNLPKELDLSMCSKVNLTDCDLSGVEKIKIKFKNKAQKEKFMKKAKNFSGKVEYDNIFTRIRDKFGTKEI